VRSLMPGTLIDVVSTDRPHALNGTFCKVTPVCRWSRISNRRAYKLIGGTRPTTSTINVQRWSFTSRPHVINVFTWSAATCEP